MRHAASPPHDGDPALTSSPPSDTRKLLTPAFIALNLVVFFSYCNMAVFYRFYQYLHELPIDPRWFGLLIGLFALTASVLRPVVSPFLTPTNSRRWVAIGSAGVVLSLLLYSAADGLWTMAILRVVHGAVFGLMAAASIACLVGVIPPERSGQAFGLIGITSLLSYAVVPPILPPLIDLTGGYTRVLCLLGLFMLPSFPLLKLVRPHPGAAADGLASRPHWPELIENLKDRPVLLLLLLNVLIVTVFAMLFFFVRGYAGELELIRPEWFFTLMAATEVAVRLVTGPLLDRSSKRVLLALALVLLAASYEALAVVSGPRLYFALGLVFGAGWGTAIPLMSALMFDLSPPRFRALNTNLGFVMFQSGFFIGPLVGNFVISTWGYRALYAAGGAVCLAVVAVTPMLRRQPLHAEYPPDLRRNT